jgi:hypothetical protein
LTINRPHNVYTGLLFVTLDAVHSHHLARSADVKDPAVSAGKRFALSQKKVRKTPEMLQCDSSAIAQSLDAVHLCLGETQQSNSPSKEMN